MLASKAKWQYHEHDSEDKLDLVDKLPIKSPITVDLLKQRGLHTLEEMNQFLTPSIDDLNSPQMLSMVDKATARIKHAIEKNEKILVFGDYDADGICATALLIKVLEELGANCDYYIPNRFTEGYGPNENAFQEAYKQGFQLIITVDTGIASFHEADVAKSLGMDLIITDHHEVQDTLPDAYAIINPKCSPDYPFKDLAGVGVVFKLAESLLGYFPEELLDLVAIGTIADLVPLVNENRILAYFGLRQLSKTNNLGLKALKKICQIDGHVTAENVGFLLGPRINAVGRISDAKMAVRLLTTADDVEAEELAEQVNALNIERQQIVNHIVKEAEQLVAEREQQQIIIVYKEGWHEGVLGIVASRLVQKFDRPAIVLTYDSALDQLKGSARSIPAFNLFENCMKIRELFTEFGGHAQAAGMTFPFENLTLIQQSLNELIENQLTEADFKQVIEISRSVQITDLTERLYEDLQSLEPFGIGNPKPIFHLAAIPQESRQIGQAKNHLKLRFHEEQHNLEGIGFGMGDIWHYITPQTEISLVGELNINEWNGIKTPQLMIKDVAINTWQLFDHRGKRTTDLSVYVREEDHHLIVSEHIGNHPLQHVTDMENVSEITYNINIDSLTKVNSLYLFDLPPSLDILGKIIANTQPENIHVCFYLKESLFLKNFPSREDFKSLYALIYHHKKINIQQELPRLLQVKNWKTAKVNFMLDVFLELEFITKEHEVIKLIENPVKTDLQQSTHYQKWFHACSIEQKLYYSTYQELRSWFAQYMSKRESPKEELVHGL